MDLFGKLYFIYDCFFLIRVTINLTGYSMFHYVVLFLAIILVTHGELH